VLPPVSRLTQRDDFAAVIRNGRRSGRSLVVAHLLAPPADADREPDGVGTAARTQVGFVVSKAVGGAVVRHRVARRLRHLMRERIDQLPPGTRLVVRALPRSATASSEQLGVDVDRALRTALNPSSRR
jgi:ribonuclease P protein component